MAESESLFKKAISTGNEFSKDEVLDILFFAKQLFGVVMGVVVALLEIMGLPGIIVFALGTSLITYLYVFKFLGVD